MVRQKTPGLGYLLFVATVGLWVGLLIMPLTVAQATVLGDLAASMQPGTWAKFSPTNKSSVNDADNWAGFSDSATWDPTSRKFIFWGSAAHSVPYRFVVYTDSTGSWSLGPNPPASVEANTFAHGNDHNTIDPATGRFYLLRAVDSVGVTNNQTLYRLTVATDAWVTLPLPPTPNNAPLKSEINAISWFPERNTVILVRGANGQVLEFSEVTQAWTVLGTVTTPGTNVYSEYSRACACVAIFSGNTDQVWQLSSGGALTRKNNAAISLYSGSGWYGHVTAEPTTGKLLVLSDGIGSTSTHQLWIYDAVLDTWTRSNDPPSTFVGGMVGTPVSTYGVVLYAICGNTTSCAADIWVYKHSDVTPAATPPPSNTNSISTNIADGAVLNGSSVVWTATPSGSPSRVEFLIDSVLSWTELSSPYQFNGDPSGTLNTTTLNDGSHQLKVRALYSDNSTAERTATVTVSNTSTTQPSPTPSPVLTSADTDFQARCNAPGVVKCVGFDNTTSDLVQNVNLFPGGDGVIHGSLDTTIKLSGSGSLKFTVPANGGANAAGSWFSTLGGNFGQNSTFYVQFRQRLSPEMLIPSNGGGGFKQVIFHHSSATCAAVEITTQNQFFRSFPQMYSRCGGDGFYTDLGTGDFLLQNGTDLQCHYQSPVSRTPPCGYYHASEWMTFYYKIQIGNWGQPNSTIQAWMGYDDSQPLKQFINMTNHQLYQNSPGDGSLYNSITLLPYDTARSSASQTAYVWYDELIVSTQPIAAPGTVSQTPSPTAQPPAQPTNLTLQ
jgi:hypothetical protein